MATRAPEPAAGSARPRWCWWWRTSRRCAASCARRCPRQATAWWRPRPAQQALVEAATRCPTWSCSTSACPTWTASRSRGACASGRRAHHRALGARPGARQDRGARRGRRRLPDQAVRRRASCSPACAWPCATRPGRGRRGGARVRERATCAWTWPRAACSCAGDEVHLTRTEYNLLATLVKHAGKVMTHRQLLKEVWGPGSTGEIALPARLHGPAPPQARGGPGAAAPPADRDRGRAIACPSIDSRQQSRRLGID